MAAPGLSTNDLLARIAADVRSEIAGSLSSAVQKAVDALAAVQAALEGGKKGGKRRGRPPGSGRKPGRPPQTAKGKRPGRPSSSAPQKAGNGNKRKRGALKEILTQIVSSAPSPMTLARIRDAVMKRPGYKGRNPKTLYTQIVVAINKIDSIVKSPEGTYTSKVRK